MGRLCDSPSLTWIFHRINLQSYKNVKCPQKKELGNPFFFSTISDILILEL